MPVKQVTIYLSRKLTLSRHGQEPIVLEPGRNVVDADVAAHQFVKHFTVEAIDASPDEVAELRARVVELTADVDTLRKYREADSEVIKTQGGHIEAVNAQLNAAAAREDALQARATALEEQLAQKEADMSALVASIEKPTKGK